MGRAIGWVAGVGLEGGQVVRPALQEEPFGGGSVPLLLMEKRQVDIRAGEVVVQVRLIVEVGGQVLIDGVGLVVTFLRPLEPACVIQEEAPVLVDAGQVLAEPSAREEVGRKLQITDTPTYRRKGIPPRRSLPSRPPTSSGRPRPGVQRGRQPGVNNGVEMGPEKRA
jgi:hypothetical protein